MFFLSLFIHYNTDQLCVQESRKGKVQLSTYTNKVSDMGIHTAFEEGTGSSPKNRNPPPFVLKQWPNTFLIMPSLYSCVIMLAFPFPRPRTPAVGGGAIGPGVC